MPVRTALAFRTRAAEGRRAGRVQGRVIGPPTFAARVQPTAGSGRSGRGQSLVSAADAPRVAAPGLFAVALIALLLLTAGTPASAHGGGPVRAIWDDAQGFYMVVESNENPAAGFLGGVVHVTMIPTATETSNVRLRGMDIQVSAIGPGGRHAGPVRAKQQLNGPYEADLMVNRSGTWQIVIEVKDKGAAQRLQFPLEVAARSALTDVAIIGGLMLVPILGIVGMVRLRRSRRHRSK